MSFVATAAGGHRLAMMSALLIFGILLRASDGLAQQFMPSQVDPAPDRPSPSASPPAMTPAQPEQSAPPGLLDEFGKIFGPQNWSLRSTTDVLESWNRSAREATESLTRMSRGQLIAGRVKCPIAANGAPDCQTAALKLCIEKGFKAGQSIDSKSVQSCPASVLLGRVPAEGNCRMDHFVTRALCQ